MISMYEARPGDALTLDPHHRDAPHGEGQTIGVRSPPPPLSDLDTVVGGRRCKELSVEVGDAGKDAGPVLPHFVAALERSARMRWLLASIVRREARHERIQVVGVQRSE